METLFRLYKQSKLFPAFDEYVLSLISDYYYQQEYDNFIKKLKLIINPLQMNHYSVKEVKIFELPIRLDDLTERLKIRSIHLSEMENKINSMDDRIEILKKKTKELRKLSSTRRVPAVNTRFTPTNLY